MLRLCAALAFSFCWQIITALFDFTLHTVHSGVQAPCHVLHRYHRMERSSQFVRRTVRMPETADLDQIKAKYDNGVLQLSIPKKEDERSRQRVPVQ